MASRNRTATLSFTSRVRKVRWIHGVFCSGSRARNAAPCDLSSADAQAGIVRTTDFKNCDRLPNLLTPSCQQRNVMMHPVFVNGQYAFYIRPLDGFVDVGSAGRIGWTPCCDITTGKEEILGEGGKK